MSFEAFHPAVRNWFLNQFDAPTEVQQQAWQSIFAEHHALLAAPTGSGKTLAAFLAAINGLVEEGLQRGLKQQTKILYISPLKALSNDIQKNLQEPIQGIRDELFMQGQPDIEIQAWVRSGDTPQKERQLARRKPPHILVTTPESIYILLTSKSGREMLRQVSTVIVDEIHALAGNKRGAHLSLSLERLDALTAAPLKRIGLSATQKPIEQMANFLLGNRCEKVDIIDTGHSRERDLALEIPQSPLDAVMANEVWQEIYQQLEVLINSHRTTLVFVNTRRLAERAARFLAERIGEEQVTSHHGSLSREHRLAAEQRLKAGELKCLVATASLELGIDIGDVDLVCQLGSPRSISAFLQRVGRSGHAIGQIPKGRLFPLSRDDLVECTALLGACQRDELDRIEIPHAPRDVLAQSVVAEVADQDWDVDELFQCLRCAWPYRKLTIDDFYTIIRMLADGFSTRRGRRAAHIHFDAVNGKIRGRRGARLTAITNGGAIPDLFDYDVILSPEGFKVGTLNEDFSFESLPGDIFQLGNTSYRILKIEQGKVFVADAQGEPPNIPFWVGEAPGRSNELTEAVSQLRAHLDKALDKGMDYSLRWVDENYGVNGAAAEQLVTYLAAAKAALGVVPHKDNIVLERFFDETNDMHLVIHSPLGSRVNRAWGLGLRKRFCRKFNFELQAAALEDTIVLSLSATHSFALDEVKSYLNSKTVRHIVIQALLDAPMFGTHWRWNATIALAVARFRNGKKTPPYFQRNDAEDLVAVVFPDQLACFENIAGEREVPDHPLVTQTIDDCLHDVMDIDGLENVLQQIEANQIRIIGRDLTAPSVLSAEVLNARPYAFLDDTPAEERRTMAVKSRSYMTPAEAADLGQLDQSAIDKLRAEILPRPRDADEFHDALMLYGFLTAAEAEQARADFSLEFGWSQFFRELKSQQRASCVTTTAGESLWVAAERLAQIRFICADADISPQIEIPAGFELQGESFEQVLLEIIRSRLEGAGPVTVPQLATPLNISATLVQQALLELEQEGFVIRGHFSHLLKEPEQWCERRLLARIHSYTVKRLRSEIEPVAPADFMRFLCDWHGFNEPGQGAESAMAAIEQLEGFAIAASAWESDVLKIRIEHYYPDILDSLCLSGQLSWTRLSVNAGTGRKTGPVRQTPIALLERRNLPLWRELMPLPAAADRQLSAQAEKLFTILEQSGAAFFADLVQHSGLLRTQVEDALGELVNHGLVTADGFSGLRALITPNKQRPGFSRRRGRQPRLSPFDSAGRWSLSPVNYTEESASQKVSQVALEMLAWTLLRRYGVVFRKLLEREQGLPPWRDLLRVYWRMEARGEIRGGRFVDSFAGEQFALPDSVSRLRSVRKEEKDGRLILISACDPLNLLGIILPGEKLSASPKNRLLLRDGVPIATEKNTSVDFLTQLSDDIAWQASVAFSQKHGAAHLRPSPRPF